jgi:GTPase SAR1 family protein
MSAQHISIVGAKGTGKTVFLAALTHALANTTEYPRIEAHPSVKSYTAGIMDMLQQGIWPPSTKVGEGINLAWEWYDKKRNKHELRTFDCAGQDFSAIFDTASETDLSDAQLELKEKFFDSDLILLLFNLREALELHGKIGKNVERLNLSWAPACALRKLKEEGVSAYVLFTQADRYEERLREEWGNDIAKALSEVLPELDVAIEETGTQCAVVNSIETEEREGERIPVAGSHPRLPLTLNRIIAGIDEFLINHAGHLQERKEILAVARAERQTETVRQREAEAARQLEENARNKNSISLLHSGDVSLDLADDIKLNLVRAAAEKFMMGEQQCKEPEAKERQAVTQKGVSAPFNPISDEQGFNFRDAQLISPEGAGAGVKRACIFIGENPAPQVITPPAAIPSAAISVTNATVGESSVVKGSE